MYTPLSSHTALHVIAFTNTINIDTMAHQYTIEGGASRDIGGTFDYVFHKESPLMWLNRMRRKKRGRSLGRGFGDAGMSEVGKF
jgi:hypothetical protein